MTLQEGTVNFLKNNKSADEIFQEFGQLIDSYRDIFSPDNFVPCEVPPLQYQIENISKNKLIDEFNCLLSRKYNNHSSGKNVII